MIAFVTDLHVREEELALHARLLAKAAHEIVARAPQLILIGGDLAGWRVPHRATVKERNALVRFVSLLSVVAPVVICRGNHDFPGDYDFFREFPNVHYIDEPRLLRFEDLEIDLYVWPWLERSRFAPGVDYRAEVLREYGETLKEEERRHHRVLLLGHVATSNGLLREGQPVIPTEDPLIDFSKIPGSGRLDAGFLGHYHCPQEVHPGIRYGGSLFLNQFGEEGDRGITFWSPGKGFDFVPLLQPRRVLMRFERGSYTTSHEDWTEGDLFKVVVPVAASADLMAAKEQATRFVEKLPKGNHRVIFEVASQQRVREGAVEISVSQTSREKLDRWLATQGVRQGQQTDLAFEILEQIENAIDTGGRTM